MDFDLSDEEREIQGTARELLAARATPANVRAAAEARSEDGALWREVAQLGWPGIAIAEEHGGQGLGLVELCVVLEQAGAALAPIPLLPSVGAALLVERAGSLEQRQRLLPALAAGEARGAIGLRRAGEALIAGPSDAEAIVLVDGASGAWLLDAGDTRLEPLESIDPLRGYMTLGASGSAADGAVGDANGASAGESLPGDVETAALAVAVAVAAESLGVCDRALQMTIAYVKDRRQFDTPVGAFQAVSHRCAEMLLHTEQARSAVYQAAWAADADPALLPAAASLAKALASEAVKSVTASAIQAYGGIGFTWEADVHWLYKRAQMNAALMGGAGEHRRRLATAIGLV
jgi:alkylation response protein AidB-like acyl-CoA dehydrogenase